MTANFQQWYYTFSSRCKIINHNLPNTFKYCIKKTI